MEALNRLGEAVRGFEVIVACPERKRNIVYGRGNMPKLTGEQALSLMQSFKGKRETIAVTYSQWATESLTLAEMREIYGQLNFV